MILPRENEPDLEELPEDTRKKLEFVLADEVSEVLEAALDGKARARLRRPTGIERRAARGR